MVNSLNARLKFVFYTALVLAFGVVFLWIWFDWLGEPSKRSNPPFSEVELQDTLLLSYALVDEETGSASLLPAFFEMSSGETVAINTNQIGNILTGFYYSLSPDGQWITFINQTTTTEGWPNALYRVNLQDKDLSASILAASTAAPATDQVKAAFPNVSNNGDILYMSVPTTTDLSTKDFHVNNGATRDIILLNQANEKELLTQGSHPQWLDSRRFLFLKEDGIYLHSLNDNQEIPLIPSLTLVGPSHRLVLNQDRTLALFIEPAAGAVRLFNIIHSANGVALQEREPIMVNATSAIFSPDGKQVAMTLLPTNGSSDVPIAIYNLEGREQYQSTLPNASSALTSLQYWIR